tara:strand:+ start:103 stop:1179 length:1077 start_codon:yes stop_codon:yes gene_type:complete
MTGTSVDALDVAIARIHGTGLEMRAELIAVEQTPLGALKAPLRAAADQTPMSALEFARLAHRFGRLHAEAISSLTERHGITPDLICLHGQTVAHDPPVGWALLDTTPLLSHFECTIVTELRHLDMAHGGQGAPISPLADWILFRGERPRTIVNLGGFCNITSLPETSGGWHQVTGRDVCPCNHLLDEAARCWLGAPMDHNGTKAMSGTANPALAGELAETLGANRDDTSQPTRALAQGDEGRALLHRLESLSAVEDRLATLTSALAIRICRAVTQDEELVLFGGGTFNQALVDDISDTRTPAPTRTGLNDVPPSAREALVMAVLGACAEDGLMITPTGASTEHQNVAHLPGKWLRPAL